MLQAFKIALRKTYDVDYKIFNIMHFELTAIQ